MHDLGGAAIGLVHGAEPSVFSGGSTEATVRAAATAAIAAGGGVVKLADATITLTQPLPVARGLRYEGVAPRITFGTGIPDSDWTIAGGTILKGDGTFAAFQANTTAAGSPPTDFTGAISDFALINIGFKTFSRAISIGATNVMGLMYSELRNLYIDDCADWAINLENFMHTELSRIWAKNTMHGYRFASTLPIGTLIPGNSRGWRNLFVVSPGKATPLLGRGIVFEGINGSLNEMQVQCQVNRFSGSQLSQTATTDGTSSIVVQDATKFAVGLTISPQNAFGNLLGKVIYVVRSVDTVNNKITISQSNNGALETPAAASGTLLSYGFPNLELNGIGTGQITNSSFEALDLEGFASCSLYGEGLRDVSIGISELNTTYPYTHVVLRDARNGYLRNLNTSMAIDFDSNCTSMIVEGAVHDPRQRQGLFFGIDGQDAVNAINLHGGQNKSRLKSLECRGAGGSGQILYPAAGPIGQKCLALTTTSLALNVQTHGGEIAYVGTADTTWTLPAITHPNRQSSNVGAGFGITNASANVLTVQTQSSQLMNQIAAKTSVAIPAGQKAEFRAMTTAADLSYGGTLFWSVSISPALP